MVEGRREGRNKPAEEVEVTEAEVGVVENEVVEAKVAEILAKVEESEVEHVRLTAMESLCRYGIL